jgi:hypothetical protein
MFIHAYEYPHKLINLQKPSVYYGQAHREKGYLDIICILLKVRMIDVESVHYDGLTYCAQELPHFEFGGLVKGVVLLRGGCLLFPHLKQLIKFIQRLSKMWDFSR